MNLVVSGVGKVAVSAAMSYLFVKMQEKKYWGWLNYGIGGHKNSALGNWFNINKVTEKSTQLNWYPSRHQIIDCMSSGLMTVDSPQSTHTEGIVCDMEASAFIATALKYSSVELIQIMKIISDNDDNSPENISKKHVQGLMHNNLSPLIQVITLLQEKSKAFSDIYFMDPLFQSCLEKWHFSQYQRKELERLIQRWKLMVDNKNLPILGLCIDAKQVIVWFKKELSERL